MLLSEEEIGVPLEDLFIITEGGCEVSYKYTKDVINVTNTNRHKEIDYEDY